MKSCTLPGVLLATVILFANTWAAKLPNYFKQCSRRDPKINECFVRHANLAIPFVVQGDKKYKIPNLQPLKIDQVKLQPGNNLELIMNKIKVYGLENAQVTDAKVDLNKLKIQMTVFIPQVGLIGEYEVHGRILVLPLDGRGPANITLDDGNFVFSMDMELYEKKGETHAKIKDHGIEFQAKKVSFKLDNLFNGNKELGEETNRFLNENSGEVGKELGPAVSETISVVITSIVGAVFDMVPWTEVVIP